jgi:uncharacterized delta-60 repeat protein
MWFSSWRNRRRSAANLTVPRVRAYLEALEDRCLLSGGVLDPTFGTGGIVTTSAWSSGGAQTVATYPKAGTANDGKIVAAGQVLSSHGWSTDFIRYNLDGTLDRSFGGSGMVTNSNVDAANDVVVQPDGKILAAGEASSGYGFAMLRYNSDGSPDTSFGGNKSKGTVITNINNSSDDGGGRLALQTDGKIVVAGWDRSTSGTAYDLALVRYNADGSLDSSFGSGGKVIQHFAPSIFAGTSYLDMAIDPGMNALDPNTGKIVVVTVLAPTTGTQGSTEVVRFNTSGSLDGNFGSSTGYVSIGPSTNPVTVAVQADDRIVVARRGGGVTRLNPGGTPDGTFGSAGTSPLPIGPWSVMIQPDGNILVAGSGSGDSLAVARYNATDGSLDSSFGANGVAVATGTYAARDAALEPDGRIVVAGAVGANSPGGFALARFLATGPQIGSFTASPDSVAAGSSVTLTAANVVALNPGSTVTQVAFYQDSNGDGILEPGTDLLLGYGVQTSPGVWTFTFSTAGLTRRTYTLFAQAQDNYGVLGDPLVISETVS